MAPHVKIIFILFICSIVGIGLGHAMIFPYDLGLCIRGNENCVWDRQYTIGEPLFYFSLALAPIFLALLFLPKSVFETWKKFGVWFIPLAIFLIFITPISADFSIDRERIAILLARLYVIVSLVIIGYKLIQLRRTNIHSG